MAFVNSSLSTADLTGSSSHFSEKLRLVIVHAEVNCEVWLVPFMNADWEREDEEEEAGGEEEEEA